MIEDVSDLPLWADEECNEILVNLCNKYNVEIDVVERLIASQRNFLSYDRARGINQQFKEILG